MHNMKVNNLLAYDLTIEQLCKRYKKLPSEMLQEEPGWIDLMQLVVRAEGKRQQHEEKRAKQKSKVSKGKYG